MANVLKNIAAMEVLAKMYLNEGVADVHFVFKVDDDVEKVPANKVILAALSPVFYTMFFGSLKEGSEVKIVDASAEAFKEFLQFFYLGDVTLTIENIETVARLADKYDIVQYFNACAAFLKSQLTIDNICWGYQLAMFLKNDELTKYCEKMIIVLPKEIFATDLFLRCDKNTLKRILDLDLLCTETNVFDGCLAWAKYACKKNDLDETKAVNLKTQLGDCLKQIRFNAMSIEEFTTFAMSNDGLFTPDEFKEIVFILTAKGYEPKLFNQNLRRPENIWNKNEILKCERVPETEQNAKLFKKEVVWFTSNQKVLLGEICSAYTNNREHIHGYNVNVIITENINDLTPKILYNNTSRNWIGCKLQVSLTQPIMIKPHIMYEVRFILTYTHFLSYYNAIKWKPTVELANGLKIQFHRNPSFRSYDTSSFGWIQSLSFNSLIK